MSELYVGNIESSTTVLDLAREFEPYGVIRSVSIPSRGYAFIEFKNLHDSQRAIHSLNGKLGWRVDFSNRCKSTVVEDSGISSCIDGPNNCSIFDCPSSHSKDIKNKDVEQFQIISLEKNKAASTLKLKPSQPPSPRWLELNEDILENILRKLGPIGVLYAAQYVCTTWRKICRDPSRWRVIDILELGDFYGLYGLDGEGVQKLYLIAVDLSQGQAMEINMLHFGDNDFVEYIAKRCGNLRCLRLSYYLHVYGKSLSKIVTGIRLLEELRLDYCYIDTYELEVICMSCRMLKTFALNATAMYGTIGENDEEAYVVATFMPELRHLQLLGNRMSNEGLESILDGCPKLESLDIRLCPNLYLEGKLGKRCAQQIKILRRPQDPIHDYEWNDSWS